MLTDQTVLSQPEWVFADVVDGEHLLLHKNIGDCFRLTAIGAAIWSHMAAPIEYKKLIDCLMQEYVVAREVCEPDVQAFLEQLQQRDLVTIA
ncbi:MAG: PqqD family peptide modification chaperone [Coxiellaceae bacterium]|nr:PqqD family peptide modification chaperone [Coxiellaceae bacterium]